MLKAKRSIMSVLALLLASACAHSTLPGTRIADTDDTRAVASTVQKMFDALKARDSKALLALVSEDYYEDMGTADASDDFRYSELRDTILPQSMAATKELLLTYRLDDIVVDNDRAMAHVYFDSKSLLTFPAGDKPDKYRGFNRVELVKKDGQWLIVAGL